MNWLRYHPCVRYPRATLILTFLVVGWFAWRWVGVEVSAETGTLLEGDRRNQFTYEKVRRILGREEVVVVSVDCGDVFTPRGMALVRRVSEAFQRQPGLVDVKSFTHSIKPIRRGWSFEMVPLVSSAPTQDELNALRRFSMDNPLIRNVMVSGDGRQAIILNTYRRDLSRAAEQREFRHEIESILAPLRAEGIPCLVLGLPLVEEEIRTTLSGDLKWIIPAAFGILTWVLRLTFGQWRMVALMGGLQVVVLLALPVVVDAMGARLNLFSTMLFPLLAAVHLAMLVHLLTAWQEALRGGGDAEEVLRRAMAVVFKPSAFSALTTLIGLASLTVSDVGLVREFGWLGVAGVLMAFGVTYGPGLAAMHWLTSRQGRAFARISTSRLPEVWGGALASFCERRQRAIAGVTVGVLLAAASGWSRLRTDANAVEFLAHGSATRQAVERLDADYGGVNVVQIEMDSGKADGIRGQAFLKNLQDVENFASRQPGVSAVYSFAQLFAMMNQIWEGERPGSLALPEQALTLELFSMALKGYPAPFLAALADERWQTAYLIVRTRSMPAERYLTAIRTVVDYAEARKPAGSSVSAAEGLHTILEADRRILRSQTDSAVLAAVGMGMALALLLRSVRLALLAMAVNVIAIAVVLGVGGWSGATLNSVTVMVAAVCLGIAIDDAVHLLLDWQRARRAGINAAEAVRAALQSKARPIIGSNLVLLGVFGVLVFSSFPPVDWFGGLAVASFAAASVTVLVVLPVMIRWWGEGRIQTAARAGDVPEREESEKRS